MGIYSATISVPDYSIIHAPAPIAEIYSDALDRAHIIEIVVSMPTTVNIEIGLGVPAVAGIGPRNAITLLPEEPSDHQCYVKIASDWATKPTVPTTFKRLLAPAQSANSFHATVIPGRSNLVLGPSASFVLWAIAIAGNVAIGVASVSVVAEI